MEKIINCNYYGFLDEKKSLQCGKIDKALSKVYNYNGIGIKTRAEFILWALCEGWRPKTYENKKTNLNGFYHYEIVKETIITEYKMAKDNYSYTITKTEFDFANFLIVNGFMTFEALQAYQIKFETEQAEKAKNDEILKQQEMQKAKVAEEEQNLFESWLNEQAENYPDNEKSETIKQMFIDYIGNWNLYHIKLLVCIDNINKEKCKEFLIKSLHNDNKTSIKAFEYITGIKLSKTYGERIKQLNTLFQSDYKGLQPYKSNVEGELYYININGKFEKTKGTKYTYDNYDFFVTGLNITEGKTGVSIGRFDKDDNVIEIIKDKFQNIGIEKFDSIINDYIKEYGISPLYQE